LATALEAFSAATGYQILMAETGSETTRSNSVKGVLSPRVALARLVAGTGLQAQITGLRDAIVIRDIHNASAAAPSPTDGGDYDAALQSTVMLALCRDAATRPGYYRAAFDLWVTSSGRIERVDLLGSTGDPVRDKHIVAAVHALGGVAPPPGLAQPTTLLILPSTGAAQSCEKTTLLARGASAR
jgi:hypothetical protein